MDKHYTYARTTADVLEDNGTDNDEVDGGDLELDNFMDIDFEWIIYVFFTQNHTMIHADIDMTISKSILGLCKSLGIHNTQEL